MDLFRWIGEKWKARDQLGDKRVGQHEIDFLPAALEIRERPPHPASRVTAWTILTLFTIGVVWACLGEVDIVATAEGKIVPSGQVKTIQPYDLGVISQILVTEGQLVKAGDPLVILDQSQTAADENRLQLESIQNRLNYLRMEQLAEFVGSFPDHNESLPVSIETSDLPVGFSDHQLRQQRILLAKQQQAFRAQYQQLDQQVLDKRAEQQANRALVAKLKGTLPLITQRVDALKSLMDKQMAARVQYLELEQLRIEQQQDLAGAMARTQQLVAQIDDLKQQQASFKAQAHSDYLQQLLQLDREYSSLQEELKKAKDLKQKQLLRSPVDGVVQDLAIHTVGGVVTSAQELMKIVPEDQTLEVEAWLENKDIGFVEVYQPAEIKVHTFPFTKYGVIDGAIQGISADAIADDQGGLIYKANVKMQNDYINVDGRDVELVSGMSVSVEVKTGKRLLIEYILTPLLRYKMDSVEER